MSITLVIFVVILLISLGITYWAAKRTATTSDFYAVDGRLTAAKTYFALARLVQRGAFLDLPD
jgi:cation/acetate symporter